MPLTAADFEGFRLGTAHEYLGGFDSQTRRRGESYFRAGHVESLVCNEPGRVYAAKVLGSDLYSVVLSFEEDIWEAECTCPMEIDCKHGYAAMKQLLAAHAAVALGQPPADKASQRPRQPEEIPLSPFADEVQKKLGRQLTNSEARYLKNIDRLFKKASGNSLHFHHELTGLGLSPGLHYWNRLELYPQVPETTGEFWNYLALYLKEKANLPLPEFLEPVTDLAAARAGMLRLARVREIERWTQLLNNSAPVSGLEQSGPAPSQAAELRLRFLANGLAFEWRPSASQEWTALKPRKLDDFEARYAASLPMAAVLLWLPFWQRAKTQYASDFHYQEPWVREQAGRWLRQPLLRPLLVNQAGEPLVFHEAPLRWRMAHPEDADGDYALALVQADGQPVPDLYLATSGQPTFYLTSLGVFPGPPYAHHVLSGGHTTSIPATALESGSGARLLGSLQIPLPPRLAARMRTIRLHPCIRAEVKLPWGGAATEYCQVQVLAASEDGRHVEHWDGNAWINSNFLSNLRQETEFITFDRTGVEALIPPMDQAGFKWDYNWGRWQCRVSKKFPEAFITFLKSLPAGTRIELAGELASFQNAGVAGKIRLEASEAGMDWFDLRVIVDVKDATLTPEEIKLLLDAKGKWVRLDQKGWRKLEFALDPEEDQELARLGLTPHELTSEPQRLHALQLADRAARKFLPEETCARIERRAAELQARVTPAVPVEIRAELRPYQVEGFHFLAYLSANRFGGVLADDMGLGKTVQTLAWLAWLRKGNGAANPAPGQAAGAAMTSLVVCPKSVADNWHAEAAKFFPALKVRVWSAADLKMAADSLATADLHVLNYSQLRAAGDMLAGQSFQAVILDEGQYIKNPSSLTAQAARRLRAEHRLILSGTPIENRLLDLWSLMSFVMPGALGSRAEFGRLYDAKNDPFARQRLSARVRPFLIRRTKAQVARDLPDRIEEDLFCELEGEQKTLYRAELKRAQAMLLGVKTAKALNQQRFNFLTSLLRLRQICCHSKLVKPSSVAPSAKVEALLETLEPIMEEGQKVLVFSQFVELLNLLRAEMKARDWPHWYLAGDTENRGALVADFQAAPGAAVFLISLKAGGFGLNLTAASYVVLFDPWWNPAVENQAIDRTHRIGQDRKVIAYRLLIKDSIEEKIRALQRRKKSLAEDVLGEEKFSQSLSLDDLRYLLAG